jgi:hypothetical protein
MLDHPLSAVYTLNVLHSHQDARWPQSTTVQILYKQQYNEDQITHLKYNMPFKSLESNGKVIVIVTDP